MGSYPEGTRLCGQNLPADVDTVGDAPQPSFCLVLPQPMFAQPRKSEFDPADAKETAVQSLQHRRSTRKSATDQIRRLFMAL